MNSIFKKAGIVVAISATILLPSCSDDDTTPKDDTLPEVTLASSSSSALVWNTVTLTVAATDDQGIDKIELKIDGTSVGTAAVSPYEFSWDTQKVSEGDHTVTAIATDKAGNEKTIDLPLTVRNILLQAQVDSDMLPVNDGYQTRGFIFLSDNDGKVIVAQEFHNSDAIALKAPAFNGIEFSVTEVITMSSDKDIALITSTQVNRGTWVLNVERDGGRDSDPAEPIGYADLTFTHIDDDADYDLISNAEQSYYGHVDIDNQTISIGLNTSPSLLYAVRTDRGTQEKTFNLFASTIKTGTNTAVDLALVNKAFTTETIALPNGFTEAYTTTRGLRTADTQNDVYRVFAHSSEVDGTMIVTYPGTTFPAYYSINEIQGDALTAYNYSKKVHDLVPLAVTLQASLSNQKFTVTASGTLDFYHIDIDQPSQRWTFAANKNTNTINTPEIPAILTDLVTTDFSEADIRVGAEDYPQVSDYASLLTFVRASKDGYYDLTTAKYSESKTLMLKLDNSGGRQGSRKKTTFRRFGHSKPEIRQN